MADKSVGELIAAQSVTPTDLFVLEQNGTAKKLTGQILENWLVSFADGHGGIQNIEKVSTDVLADTYRITLSDTTTFDFVVTNGRSIDSIEKTNTSGLVDTYTITYNDGTTDAFNVTNGDKGDKGDNTYVWIKYASQKPTNSSHSFGDVPDSWIGIYFGNLPEAPEDWTKYVWYNIKGEKGDTGYPATLVSASVTYQVGDSGTIIPSGTWLESIPVVSQGKYLWTKIVQQFNTGNGVTAYSVSRMGMDGLGAVVSVCGVSPDANGNVLLDANDVNALPTEGGDMNGGINMNGQKLTGLNDPEDETDAARKSYVDTSKSEAIDHADKQIKKSSFYTNILDNSNFRNPVNQRASNSYTAVGYTIDRWRTWDAGAVSIVEGGITNTVTLYQYLEQGTVDASKVHTFAVGYADGSVAILSGKITDGAENSELAFGFDTGVGYNFVKILASNKIVQWAALYEGEFTAENLPKYNRNEYTTELLKCMRYFEVAYSRAPASKGNFDNAYLWGATLNFRVPKRIIPTITTIENWFPGWYVIDQVGALQYECNVYQAWPKIISGAGTVTITDFIGKQHHVTAYICADL